MTDMPFDTVIGGGTCVTALESFRADIGIRNGRIAALGQGLHGREVIDARGKLVMPGGIEAHCHIAQNSATGGLTADDYTSGSISAAFGGNSCIISTPCSRSSSPLCSSMPAATWRSSLAGS